MKIRIVTITAVLFFAVSARAQQPLYKNAKAPIEDRVNDLLGRMTVNEKVGQLLCPLGWPMYTKSDKGKVGISDTYIKRMTQMPIGSFWAVLRADPWTQKTLTTGLNPKLAAEALNALQKYAVEKTRLGIPILFAEEAPHGHMAIGATVFPTALSQASTFDEELIQKMGEAIGLEVRAQGAHVGYGPVLDIAREPRWSRMEETFGEDPVLTGILGTAMVKGMQGQDYKDGKHVYSTLKHFAAYGIPEGGLNGEQANVGQRTLFSELLPQFKRAVKAGVASIMTSYNSIDGVPCTANKYLLTDVLRNQWGFKGAVFSDLQSIEGIASTHHVAEDWGEAGVLALKAGVDFDLEGNSYGPNLEKKLQEGKITMEDLDRAVRNVLRLKFQMGLFENPYVDPNVAAKVVRSKEHKELARQVAREGVVLLKNDGLLPLSKNLKRVAVIGPNADMMYNQLGDYTAPQDRKELTTVLDGVKNLLPKAQVTYVKGCAVRDTTQSQIKEAVAAAKAADVTILVVGGSSARDFETTYLSTGAAIVNKNAIADMECGEGYDRADLHLMGDQEKLMKALLDSGVKLVVVYIQGRPLNMNLASEQANALLTAWYPGEQGGQAIADVLFGDYNPAGRLPVGIPRNVGQLPVHYSKHPSHNYVDSSADPLFSFGYGLSYTKFEYSDLQLVPGNEMDVYQTVKCTVKNVGNVDGDEVVQLYINDVVASVEPLHKALKGFKRIHLKAGESKEITFNLGFEELSLYNMQMQQVVEPGKFRVMIGAASNDIRLNGEFEIE
ncbi:MAG: glycoside hydrolase family 3 C-terminal domain-containing protein [Bacteroidaceae bacterium]|nr:glycoside hydrolase family 3 C-terminal domain-containing protein [Bacteroidaceae bacterium]